MPLNSTRLVAEWNVLIDFNWQVEPDFQILDQIVLNDVQDVFAVDALESSHPISVDVNDPKDINELFDRISYGKGGCPV